MINLRQSGLVVLFLMFFLLLTSCDSKRYFEENKIIEKGVWDYRNRVRFVVPVNDTVARFDFYLQVRNDSDYPYSNLYLFIKTISPDGTISKDTVECRLADDFGKWLGSGMGSVKINRFLFQRGVRFPQKGNYTFELEQAMRVKELKGIRDLGIRIEKNNP